MNTVFFSLASSRSIFVDEQPTVSKFLTPRNVSKFISPYLVKSNGTMYVFKSMAAMR